MERDYKWAINIMAISFLFIMPLNCDVLCVDIGATRIKAAVLSESMTLDELQDVNIITMSSREWLNESLPKLFDKNSSHNLGGKVIQPYEYLSFGITGPVSNNRLYINPFRLNIPRQLADECEDVLGAPVSIENDTTIWVFGALYWQKLIKNEIKFPCLCITLGTGVGVALLTSLQDITLIEISLLDIPFNRLNKICKDHQNFHSGSFFGQAIGNKFFDWVHMHNSWSKDIIENVFNNRLIAFIKDMQEFFAKEMDIKPKNILIGGGNSRFVSRYYLQNSLKKEIMVIAPAYLNAYGVSPDIISLLGCVQLPSHRSVSCMPALETIL